MDVSRAVDSPAYLTFCLTPPGRKVRAFTVKYYAHLGRPIWVFGALAEHQGREMAKFMKIHGNG